MHKRDKGNQGDWGDNRLGKQGEELKKRDMDMESEMKR